MCGEVTVCFGSDTSITQNFHTVFGFPVIFCNFEVVYVCCSICVENYRLFVAKFNTSKVYKICNRLIVAGTYTNEI